MGGAFSIRECPGDIIIWMLINKRDRLPPSSLGSTLEVQSFQSQPANFLQLQQCLENCHSVWSYVTTGYYHSCQDKPVCNTVTQVTYLSLHCIKLY